MLFLRTLSKIFMGIAALIALYDACYSQFIKNKFNIRPLKDFWTDIHKDSYTAALPHLKSAFDNWDKIEALPAPVIFIILGVICYVIFKLIFMARGGRGGDGFNYKSPY